MKKITGFTLVELLVGLAIFGLLAVMAVSFGRSSLQRASFSSAVNTFLSDFSSVKQQAATENRYMVIDFNAAGTGYVIRRQQNLDDFANWDAVRTITPMDGMQFFLPGSAQDFVVNSVGEVFTFPIAGTPQPVQVSMNFFIYKRGTTLVDYQRLVRIFPTGGIKIDE